MKNLLFDSYVGFDTCMAVGALCDMTKKFSDGEKILKSFCEKASLIFDSVKRCGMDATLAHIDVGGENIKLSISEILNLISESGLSDNTKKNMKIWCNVMLNEYALINECEKEKSLDNCTVEIRNVCEAAVCFGIMEIENIQSVGVTQLIRGCDCVFENGKVNHYIDPMAQHICDIMHIETKPSDIRNELITLPGAAMLYTLNAASDKNEVRTVLSCGYGAGAFELYDISNILRAVLYDDGDSLFDYEKEYESIFGEFAVL